MAKVEPLTEQTVEARSGSGYVPISDYGVVGDCRSAALISREGSVDWCCWPNFHSPSVFARLLDCHQGGHFSIRPLHSFQAERRYLGASNVLETTFHTPSGVARVTDLMPALPEDLKRRRLMPLRSLLRRVEGVSGAVEMEIAYSPRFEYGAGLPRLRSRTPLDVYCEAGRRSLHLRSDLVLVARGADCRRKFAVRQGERRYFSLAYDEDAPEVYPSVGTSAEEEIAATLDYWRDWSARCSYSGPYHDAVLRSALLLKLLAFAPSGAVVAAPTTSLPERSGGRLNWDYRYCWLRDASFTVRALYSLGYPAEGDAFVSWMMHATRLTHPALQVLYDVYGESRIPEREVSHLEGYRRSQPVRVGNGAYDQFQLDVYGEVMAALEQYYDRAGGLDSDTRGLLLGIADLVADRWQEPDNGIWERRGRKRHYVHSKAMAWRALDCAARIHRKGGLRGDLQRWESARDEIHRIVLSEGFDPGLGSFVETLGGREPNGALLALPLIGLVSGNDPRMIATLRQAQRLLTVNGLVHRAPASIGGGPEDREGAFLTCSFWLVSALALAGSVDEAHQTFESLLARGNDLGLFAEEMDPGTGEYLGNYPLGLTHIALVNAALTLQEVEGKRAG